MPRAGIRAGGAAVASSLALGLAMTTAATCRAESLQDAWAAALAANQGLQAAQAGTASARSGAGVGPGGAAAHAHHGQRLHLAEQHADLQEQRRPARLAAAAQPLVPVPEPGVLLLLDADEHPPLHRGPHHRGHRRRGGPGRGGPRRGVHRRHGPEAGGDSGVSERPPRPRRSWSWPGATSPASRPTSATCGTCSGRGSPSGPTCSPPRSRWRGPASA